MKQLTVISGKGGTGKTTITAALANLAKSKITADCDVDAADLYLLFKPKQREQFDFKASKVALIDTEKCIECSQCVTTCRFEAISTDFVVDPISCEGCGVCWRICPVNAISCEEKLSGRYFIGDSRFGTLVHARLEIAEENSGKLVTTVRKKARELAQKEGAELILIDGSPGIGCPVIASLTGVDLALVVSEPTLSGIHDLERVLELTAHFRIKTMVCVNKYDINLENVAEIKELCRKHSVKLIGRIPYDPTVNQALRQEKTIIEHSPDSKVSREISSVWEQIKKDL